MKKALSWLLLFVFVFALSGGIASATAGSPGAYAEDSAATNPLSPSTAVLHYSTDDYTRTDLCQKIKPSKSVIADYLYANVAGRNTAGAVMLLRADNNGTPGDGSLGIYNAPAAFEDPGHTYMTRFSTEGFTQVTANEFYWLCLVAPAGNDVWWYATTPSSYNNGFLKAGDNNEVNQDFGFQIWSSDMETPAIVTPDDSTPDPTPGTTPTTTTPTATSSTPAASTPLPAGVAAGSGAAPAAPTAAIKSPTEVTVADLPADQGGSLKLDWKASKTTDIDGYKVFRSTTEVTKDFKEIVKTEKTILTYTDNTAAIGQKYYYMIRAYKGTSESASSSIVNAISSDNLAPAAPVNFTYKQTSNELFNFTWDKNAEPDLAGYSLMIVNNEDNTTVVETIEIAKDVNAYALDFTAHEKLVDAAYVYQLVAKDANGNISEKAIAKDTTGVPAAVANTEKSAGNNNLWYIVGGAILILLLAIAMWWFIFKTAKVSRKFVWLFAALIIIVAALVAWLAIPSGTNNTSTNNAATSTAPKHADWKAFTAAKNGLKFYYPAEYVVTEGAGGNITVNRGSVAIADVYSVSSDGDDAGTAKAYGAMYTDAAKGYMAGGVESSVTAAGQNAKKYTGVFGKNAGAQVMVHDGIKGSTVIFAKNNRTWLVDSYDNDDAAAKAIFDDILLDMSI